MIGTRRRRCRSSKTSKEQKNRFCAADIQRKRTTTTNRQTTDNNTHRGRSPQWRTFSGQLASLGLNPERDPVMTVRENCTCAVTCHSAKAASSWHQPSISLEHLMSPHMPPPRRESPTTHTDKPYHANQQQQAPGRATQHGRSPQHQPQTPTVAAPK